MPHIDRLMTEAEVAERLKMRRQTLRLWRVKGQHLPFFRVDRNIRYQESDVEAFIAQSRRVSTSAEAAA